MNIHCKSDIYPLASQILEVIIEKFERPKYLSESQKESCETLEKIYSEFRKTLNSEQKKLIDEFDSARNSIENTNKIYWLLYGMKIYKKLHEVLNEMSEKPAEVVKYFDDNADY